MVYPYAFIDIIIRRDALERKETGLSQKFIEENEIDQSHYDDKLICIIGGMNSYDVDAGIKWLVEEYGLVFNQENVKGGQTDIVVVDFMRGARTNNNWLKSTGTASSRQYYFEEDK